VILASLDEGHLNVSARIIMSSQPDMEMAYPKLIYYNRLPKGGHFAAREQPKFLSEEIRAGFRSSITTDCSGVDAGRRHVDVRRPAAR
jgi:hypothetical protein